MKKMISLCVLSLSLSSCVLKTEHDASIASYKKKADAAQSLQSNNTELSTELDQLKSQIAQLSTRNQELSTLNQQLVQKNSQFIQSNLSTSQQQFDDLQKAQQRKKLYLNLFENLKKNIPQKSGLSFLLKDDYLGIEIKRSRLFTNSKPVLSKSGRSLLTQIASVLPPENAFSLSLEYNDVQRPIKRWLKNTYVSQLSLRSFEAGHVLNAFENIKNIQQRNVSSQIQSKTSSSSNSSNISYTLKIVNLN